MKTFSQLFGKRQSLSNFGMWQLLFTVAGAISAADSIYVLYFPMKLQFEASFGSPFAALVISLLVCAAYLLIVDISLMRFLPNTLAGIFDKNVGTGMKSNLGKLYWGTFLFCILQTAATVFVSFHLRHSSVEISSDAPVLTDIKALADGQNAAQAAKVAAAEKEIARLKSDKEKAVNNVPQKAAKMQEWGKGGSYVERMNAFKSAQKSVEADNKAAKKAAGSVYDKQLEAALNAKNGILNDPTLLTVVNAADKVNTAKLERHAKKTANFSDFLLIMSLAASFVLWFAGSMIGFHYAEFGVKHDTLMPGTTGSYSGAAAVALSTGDSATGGLSMSFKKHTSELVAVHEAGHLCAYAHMNAQSQTAQIKCRKMSIEPDGATGALGYVVMDMQYDETETQNLALAKEALTAGVAAEFVALGKGTAVEYLKQSGYVDGTNATDYTRFQELAKFAKGDDFERAYLKMIQFFQNDNAMLKIATSEILSKKTIDGTEMTHLFAKMENWYRGKLGKELIAPTPSVEPTPETPKTAEKAVIEPKTPVITEKEPVITEPTVLLKFKHLTDSDKNEMLEWLKLPSQAIEWEYIIVCDEFNPVMDKVAVSEQGKKVFAPTNSEYIVEIAKSRLAQKTVIEAQKTVITEEKTVITEKQPEKQVSEPIELEITQPSNESWLSNLKTIEVENETYTPNDLITAKSYILTYWSRAFSSKSDAKKEENREKALRFKTVLEMTGLKVELFDNGKGKVTF